MNTTKTIYWISTGIMCLIFLFSAYNYFFNYEMIVGFYKQLGYPVYLIYPSAIAKVLGVIAILSRKSALLKEWAYAGFFFDAALALTAHTVAEDGGGMFAMIALIAVLISRFTESKTFDA